MNVSRLILLSPKNGGIADISSNREHPFLFRTRHLVVQNCFLHQSFLDMLPLFLLKGNRGDVGRPLWVASYCITHEV
jgi:hypothetical protein